MESTFEYLGGSRDGQIEEGEGAAGHYKLTNDGTLGARFSATTQLSKDRVRQFGNKAAWLRSEEYEVVKRSDEGNVVQVRCKLVNDR